MDRLFYVIFNSYFKNGNFKNDQPLLTAGGFFIMIFFSILKFLARAYKHFIDEDLGDTLYELHEFFYVIVGLIIYFFVFIFRKRYEKIYFRYQNNEFLNKKVVKYLGFLLAYILIFIPWVLIVVFFFKR